jgi:hypothetical protein
MADKDDRWGGIDNMFYGRWNGGAKDKHNCSGRAAQAD